MAGYYIDAAMLRKRGACSAQVFLFVRTFGEGRVLLTLENVQRAMDAGLDVRWPATEPWFEFPGLNDALESLRDRATEAWLDRDPNAMLSVLMEAQAAWATVDAERATGGHR